MQESTPGIVFRMRVSIWAFQRLCGDCASCGRGARLRPALRAMAVATLMAVAAASMQAQSAAAAPAGAGRDSGSSTHPARLEQTLPPRVVEAERFLARRGWPRAASVGMNGRSPSGANALVRSAGSMRGLKPPLRSAAGLNLSAALQAQAQTQTQGSAIWLPLGPVAVQSQNFGLVTGRVSALALDPSDATGNTLYVGTTGGGVWRSQNADTSEPGQHQLHPAHRQPAGAERRCGRLHQHWRAERAAGRDGSDSGRHRRPQRRSRLLLWRGNSALDRRRKHLEPDLRPPRTSFTALPGRALPALPGAR